jgi:hypothetical protein
MVGLVGVAWTIDVTKFSFFCNSIFIKTLVFHTQDFLEIVILILKTVVQRMGLRRLVSMPLRLDNGVRRGICDLRNTHSVDFYLVLILALALDQNK